MSIIILRNEIHEYVERLLFDRHDHDTLQILMRKIIN